MNIFERASRQKLMIPMPSGGVLPVDQLWDLPLTVTNTYSKRSVVISLDDLAQHNNKLLKEMGEESFVKKSSDPLKAQAELRLEILKHIIQSKMNDAERAEKAAVTRSRKAELDDLIREKELEEKKGKTLEELKAERDALNA